MQWEECKAAGGESGLDRFVSLKPLCAAGMGLIAAPHFPGKEGAHPWHWEGSWEILGRESRRWGTSVMEQRLQVGFLLGAWDARGCSSFTPGRGRCICVGSAPALGFKPLPGAGGLKHLRARWGLTG